MQKPYKELEPFFSPSFKEPTSEERKIEKKEIPIQEAIKMLQRQTLMLASKYPALFDINQIQKDFSTYVDFHKLPKSMYLLSHEEVTGEVDVDLEEEDIQETEQEQMAETEVENEKENDGQTLSNFKPALPLAWEGNLSFMQRDKPEFSFFGIEGFSSPNYRRISEDPSTNESLLKPAYQTLFLYHPAPQNKKLVLLDLHDAKVLLNRMTQGDLLDLPPDTQAYLLSGQQIIVCSNRANTTFFKKNLLTVELSLLTKCVSRFKNLTKEEKGMLEKGFQNDPTIKVFVEKLFSVWPQMEKAWLHMDLAEL